MAIQGNFGVFATSIKHRISDLDDQTPTVVDFIKDFKLKMVEMGPMTSEEIKLCADRVISAARMYLDKIDAPFTKDNWRQAEMIQAKADEKDRKADSGTSSLGYSASASASSAIPSQPPKKKAKVHRSGSNATVTRQPGVAAGASDLSDNGPGLSELMAQASDFLKRHTTAPGSGSGPVFVSPPPAAQSGSMYCREGDCGARNNVNNVNCHKCGTNSECGGHNSGNNGDCCLHIGTRWYVSDNSNHDHNKTPKLDLIPPLLSAQTRMTGTIRHPAHALALSRCLHAYYERGNTFPLNGRKAHLAHIF